MFDTLTPYGTAFPDRYNIYQGGGVIIAYAERWILSPERVKKPVGVQTAAARGQKGRSAGSGF